MINNLKTILVFIINTFLGLLLLLLSLQQYEILQGMEMKNKMYTILVTCKKQKQAQSTLQLKQKTHNKHETVYKIIVNVRLQVTTDCTVGFIPHTLEAIWDYSLFTKLNIGKLWSCNQTVQI